MVATGLLALIEISLNGFPDFSDFFIAAYMILFAVLLFVYEMMWWCTVDKVNKLIRKNFGFMYKIHGKAGYLIFVALLCVGLDTSILDRGNLEWLQWFTGIAWALMGFILVFILWLKPRVFRNYQAPSGGYLNEGGAENTV